MKQFRYKCGYFQIYIDDKRICLKSIEVNHKHLSYKSKWIRKNMFGNHLRSAIFVIFISILVFLFLTYREINKSVENREGLYYSSEIKDTVSTQRDRFSLPRIEASNEEDLYYGLGKTIAQDRLFQLRLFQIVLNGKYSELIDGNEIELDVYIKNLNLDALADSLQCHTSPTLLNLLQKYCDGINNTVSEKKLNISLPFIISETEPAPWTIKDILKLYSFLTISGSLNRDRDIFLSSSKAILTKKQFRFLCKFYEIDYHKVISLANNRTHFVPQKLNEIFPPRFQVNGFPFFSGENYFITLYTAPTFPAFYYPLLLSKEKLLNKGVTIPGLPIIYQDFSHDQVHILSYPDNPEYSLKKIRIKANEIVKEEFSIKTLARNESDFERITLENGFALSNLLPEEGNIEYFAFDKKKFYNSFGDYFKINNNGDKSLLNDTTIFPAMNYFLLTDDTLFSKIVPTEKRRFEEHQQFSKNIIKDAVYRKNTENEKFFRIESGDFLLDYLHQQTDNFKNSLNSHIFQTLLGWDRVAIPESKATYYFNSLITNLIKNIFQNEFGANIDYFLKDRRSALDFIEYILIKKSNLFISGTKAETKEIFDEILMKSIKDIKIESNGEQGRDSELFFSYPLNKKKYERILSVPKTAVSGSEFSFKKVKKDIIPAVVFKFKSNKIADVEFSFAGGISGNPLSNHYKKLQKYWQKDIYMKFEVKDSKNGKNKLTLIPGK